jgi:hypothetical protein
MRPPCSTERERPPLLESYEVVIAGLILAVGWFAWYLARERYHLTQRQVAEIAVYLAIAFVSVYAVTYLLATRRPRREKQWPHPPLVISQREMRKTLGRRGTRMQLSLATTYTESHGFGRTVCG